MNSQLAQCDIKITNNFPKQTNVMTVEYMFQFATLPFCEFTSLLSQSTIKHLWEMQISETTYYKKSHSPKKSDNISQPFIQRSSIIPPTPVTDQPAKTLNRDGWVRKDYTKEIAEAEELRNSLLKAREEDRVKDELVDKLNKITVDTYKSIKDEIIEVVKDSVESQFKLIEVLFYKAIRGGNFLHLYTKLCRDLDKVLPQKAESVEGKPAQTVFRKTLLGKCKEIFSLNMLNDFSVEVGEDDQILALKKLILGNVAFVSELICSKAISKKLGLQCVDLLYSKLEQTQVEDKENQVTKTKRLLIVEGMLILIDRYGTFINLSEKSKRPEELTEANKRLDQSMSKLEIYISKNKDSFPGYLQFKLINLIEKKKRGWELSGVDKLQKAKGLKELNEEPKSETRKSNVPAPLTQDEITNLIKTEIIIYKANIDSRSKHDWSISNDLYNRNVKIYQRIQAIHDISIDYVSSETAAEVVYSYFYDMFKIFYKSENEEDRQKARQVMREILLNLSDTLLDNPKMTYLFSQVYFILTYFKFVRPSDLDSIDLNEEQASGIFEMLHILFNVIPNDPSIIESLRSKFAKTQLVIKHNLHYHQIVTNKTI